MSTTTKTAKTEHRITVRSLERFKRANQPITMMTAYDFCFAQLFDRAGIDVLLVGDSLANVVQGRETTLPVTCEEMIYHTKMVSRGASRSLVVADMPFGSYQGAVTEGVQNAIALVKEGDAHAVKLEGGRSMHEVIACIVGAEIPVMGHVGLTPQSVHKMGGYRVQGRGITGRERIIEDARAVQEAGAFAVVLEGVPQDLASAITNELVIPTIGIGAGVECDGQVLVMHDLLGLNEGAPSFVKQYARLGAETLKATRNFIDEVRERKFPDPEHSYE